MSVYMIVSGATIKPSQVVRDLGSRRRWRAVDMSVQRVSHKNATSD